MQYTHTVAIIGPTGARGEFDTLADPAGMFEQLLSVVRRQMPQSHCPVRLVSGGSAWCDHVAAALCLAHPEDYHMHLALPCAFDRESGTFDDSREGRMLNRQHEAFSRLVGRGGDTRDALADLLHIRTTHAVAHCGVVPSERFIADSCTHAMVFYMGPGSAPKRGDRAYGVYERIRQRGIPMISIGLHVIPK